MQLFMHILYVIRGVAKGGQGGATAPPIAKKNRSLKKAKSVEKWGGGVHVTFPKLKLIKRD